MNFFIKKNSTSKPLKVEILKTGRKDYDQVMSDLSNAVVTFSMKDVKTDRYVILNDEASIEDKHVYYYFNKKQVSKIGSYKGEFKVTLINNQYDVVDNVFTLPINDDLFINIMDSISKDDLCCKQDGNFEFINLTETARLTPTPTPTSTQTPTPTQTSTQTPTPTQTSTQTPTQTNTSTVTPTQTPTQTPSLSNGATPPVTPTPTKTPFTTSTPTPSNSGDPIETQSVTPTNTKTPTPTPSVGGTVYSKGYLLIEPESEKEFVSNYLSSNGADFPDFRGFWYALPINTNLSIQLYMGLFSSQINNNLLIYELSIPQNTTFGTYLFETINIPIGTVNERAWYTLLIPDESMGGNFLTSIKYGISSQTLDTTLYTDSTLYNFGPIPYDDDGTFITGNYRIYSSWPSNGFMFNDTNNDIFIKGGST